MKKIIALFLCCTLILTGCSSSATKNTAENNTVTETSESTDDIDQEFSGLDDETLLPYIEDSIYENLVEEMDDDSLVENVEAIYLSDEYLEEAEYNSKSNVYFGYTLAELEEQFEGDRYVFTLGDDGQTTVKKMETISDDTYNQVIKNVAVGTGVILICVTVSVATAGTAPAVSMIFAASATSATTAAAKTGGLGFVAASLARAYQTHDFDEAMKAGALAASEGFKWGAVYGALAGGVEEYKGLKGAKLNGLTMNEAATIQKETKWPLDAIKSIHSTAEAEIYQKAELVPTRLSDDSWAFIRKINWNKVDEYGRTNIQRIQAGLSPLDETGIPYELHHIGQKADSPLAILTKSEHMKDGNNKILHYQEEGKDVVDAVWKKQKKAFWKEILEMSGKG